MTLTSRLAGLALVALLAMSAYAQHGVATAGRAGGATLAAPPVHSSAQASPSGARPSYLPAPVGVHPLPGSIVQPHPPLRPAPMSGLGAASSFALQNAPRTAFGVATLHPSVAIAPKTFLGRGYRGGMGYGRAFSHFPNFFFGGGPSACSPLLPGFFGSPWFDRQFTCFGTPFFGVNFYPQGFLAPQLAYEPWLAGLPIVSEGQMYSVEGDTLLAGDLDLMASIAAHANRRNRIRISRRPFWCSRTGFVSG